MHTLRAKSLARILLQALRDLRQHSLSFIFLICKMGRTTCLWGLLTGKKNETIKHDMKCLEPRQANGIPFPFFWQLHPSFLGEPCSIWFPVKLLLALPNSPSHRGGQVTQAGQPPGHSRAGASTCLTQQPLILVLFDILWDFCVTFAGWIIFCINFDFF